MPTNLDFENSLWKKGIDLIAGVDEVGRGALAGPMVVAAVVLQPKDLIRVYNLYINNDVEDANPTEQSTAEYTKIKDSKLLTPKKRGELSEFIIHNCVCYSIAQVSNGQIDTLGISACTQITFSGAVKSLKYKPEHTLTDAFAIREFPQTVQTNIKTGDRLSISISAASIVAKVFRDSLMCEYGKLPEYQAYAFERHKGYGTKLHKERLVAYGLSNLHRKTFIHLD